MVTYSWLQMKDKRSNSVDYLTGLSVHWYWDDIFEPIFIDVARKEMPDKIMLVTESCIGDKPWESAAPLLGSWKRGEKYARNFLQDLQHDFNGWIDWNIVLDEEGGPNYVNNFVDAPSVANMTSTVSYLQCITLGDRWFLFSMLHLQISTSFTSNQCSIRWVISQSSYQKVQLVLLQSVQTSM